MRSDVTHATRLAAILLALSTTLACGTFRLPFMGGQSDMSSSSMTEDDLRNELSGYAARFGATVSDAAEDIKAILSGREKSEQVRIIRWVGESLGVTATPVPVTDATVAAFTFRVTDVPSREMGAFAE